MTNEPDDAMKTTGNRLIPFQASPDFVELMDSAVELTRQKEQATHGEAVTDRSKWIRAAIREKAARIGVTAQTEAA